MQTIEFSAGKYSTHSYVLLRTNGFSLQGDGIAPCYQNALYANWRFYKATQQAFQALENSGKYELKQTF